MPKEQQTKELPNKARENLNSNPSRMDVTQPSTNQSDDKPKCPSTYQDWASF